MSKDKSAKERFARASDSIGLLIKEWLLPDEKIITVMSGSKEYSVATNLNEERALEMLMEITREQLNNADIDLNTLDFNLYFRSPKC